MTKQQSRCTTVTFFGVRSGVGVTTLAVNIAATLGVVARRRTLLLDLSGNERSVSSALGISGGRGLLGLTTPFLWDDCISPDGLAEQVVRYEPGEPWSAGISALDVLPGFDRAGLSPADEQRLHAYYGVALVRAVCESACLAGYEFVVADGGIWPQEKLAFGMLRYPGQAALVSSSQENDIRKAGETLSRIREAGWYSIVIFNQTDKRQFEWVYGGATSLEKADYRFIPTAKMDKLDQGATTALVGLQDAKTRHDRFVSALVGIASEVNEQLKGEALDCRGRPIRL